MKDLTTEFVGGSICLICLGIATGESKPNMKLVLATAIVVLGLSIINNVDSRISSGLAAIIFFSLSELYLIPIMKKIGLTKGGLKDIKLPEKVVQPSQSTTETKIVPADRKSQFTPNGGNGKAVTPNDQLRNGLGA